MTLQSKVVFLSSLVGSYWDTLLLMVIALLCHREILANKYPCVYRLLQKAWVYSPNFSLWCTTVIALCIAASLIILRLAN